MNTYKLSKSLVSVFILLTFMVTTNNSKAAITDLATSPITVATTSQEVLPNIMFVLDDSGSMRSDFLPDWADPLLSFQYQYKNASYNGVAYNPATYYSKPVMYTSSGSADSTTYPDQTSANTSDWTVVKNDGYGIQSTATSVLKNNAYFYTTIPGEYCNGPQLRNCVASASATGSYTYPAKLRWCDTPTAANGTTANSNGHCQASQIASTPTNTANGVTSYTFPRAPSPGGTSSISFSGVGAVTVTGITVSGAQILSASVSNTVAINSDGSSLPGLLNAIVDSINLCTNSTAGACTVAGYSAVSDGISVISVSAPTVTTVTPVVNLTSTIVPITNPDGSAGTSHVTTTTTAFAQTPGSVVKTIITSTTSSYPYPGTSVKSSNRTDCAGTTCTYAEEMTNYANWWAYYHTRMQMMKTGVSLAFSTINDQYRVGYFSINNGSYNNPSSPGVNSDYLNVSAFTNTQKYSWYTKFFNAYPYGQTPLRLALSNAGRIYSGKLNSLYNQTVADPMQYSCQQNFTILSTDGYWNDQTTPTQADGSTAIGQQDGSEARPYYDGATQVQTVSQTLKTVKQAGTYQTTVQNRTTQQYKSSSDLTQTVTTTDTYPWRVQTTTLQTSSSQLQAATRALQTTTTKLQSSTYVLQEGSFQPQTSTYPLITSNFLPQISTYQLVQSNFQPTTNTFALNETIFNPTVSTSPLNQQDFNPTVSTYALSKKDFQPTQSSYALNKFDFQPQVSTFQLQSTSYQLQSTTTSLNKTTYGLQSSTSQLQKRVRISTNGGDTYTDSGWQNENTSCSSGTTTVSGTITITACQYTSYTAYSDISGSCTTVPQSSASPYTQAVAVSCRYSATPVVVSGQPSCTVNPQQTSSPYNPQITCAYGSASAPVNASGTCTTIPQSSSSPYQAAVSCGYATGVAATTSSCSTVAKSTSSPYTVVSAVDCAYQAAVVTSAASCTVTAKQTGSPYSGPAVTCGYSGTASTTTNGVSSCTIASRAAGTTTGSVYGIATDCSYATTATTASVASCTVVSQSTGATNGTVYSGPSKNCAYPGTATATTANQTSCTITARSSATTNGTVYPTATDCTYGSAVTSSAATCTIATQSTGSTTGTVYSGPAIGCSYPGTATSTTANVASCTSNAGSTATTNGTVYNPKRNCTYGTATTASAASCTVVSQSTASPYAGPAVACSYPGTATTTNSNVATCSTVAGATATTNGTVYSPKKNCAYSGTATTSTAATCTSVAASTASPYAGPYKTCTYPGTATSTANVATCTPITRSTSNTYQTAVDCGYATTATVTNGTCTVNTGTITAGVYTGNRVSCSYPGTPSSTASGVACTTAARQTSTANGAVWAQATECAYSGTATVTSSANCTVNTGSTASPYTVTNKVSCAYPPTATVTNTVTSCSTAARATAITTGTVYGTAKDCAYSGTATTASNLDTCTSVNRSTGSPYSGPAVDCAYQSPVVTTGTSCTVSAATTTAVTNGSTYTRGIGCSYAAAVNSNVTSCTTAAMSAGPTNYTGPAVTCSYGAYSAAANATAACTPAAQSAGPTNYSGPAVNCTYTSPVTTYSGTCATAAQNNTNLTARVCTAGTYPFLISTIPSIVSSCTPAHPSTTTAGVTRDIATTCAYNAYTTPVPALCTAVSQGMVSGTYPTAVNCTTNVIDWANVPSCTSVGTISPPTYDGGGQIVQCRTTAPTATVPVASCTPSTGSGPDYTQTNCLMLQDSTTPVQTCNADPATSANNYVNTTCDSSTIQSNIAVCSGQIPSAANGYKTVICGTTGGTSNTLADVAEYYYKTDLRTTAFGNCTGAPVGSTSTTNILCDDPDTQYNNVPTSGVDLNPAQHMTTFTLGLGASGFMQYSPAYISGGSPDYEAVRLGTTANPSAGTCAWQNGGDCNWPFPINNDQTGVDDLWHAGVNGRGAYFSATDPATLANSLSSALSSVSAAKGSATGASTSNPNVSLTDNFIFVSTFTTGSWDGDVNRRRIDPSTGNVSASIDWEAQSKLDNKPFAQRQIYTFDSDSTTKLKSFTATNYGANAYFNTPAITTSGTGLSQFLCATPNTCLTSADQTAAAGSNLVNYLRGDRSNEGAKTDNTKYYRQRSHVLGDIVNSPVTYVGSPKFSYADPGYVEFSTANASRQAVVYVGANDGMLHAFRAKGSPEAEAASALVASNTSNAAYQTAAANAQAIDVAAGVDGGQELWSYIPGFSLPNLYKLADKNYSTHHRNFVDGPQEVTDICVSGCDSSGAVWKTILVGGLGRGGRSYYALDITDPSNPKGLWEYTDSNLGYTYGNPQIAKQSDGRWVATFTSGYNNVPNEDGTGGDGQGRLYVVDAYTGAFIRSISTGVGSTTTPSGLSKIVARVQNANVNSTIQAIYGGDLYGNLWRFDINDNIGASGYDAQLLAQLSDSAGHEQPITTKPKLALIDDNLVVFIGTGSYLGISDLNDTDTQSVYAIKDPLLTTTTPSTAIYPNPHNTGSGFVQQTQTTTTCPSGTDASICAPNQIIRTSTSNPVNFAINAGWYFDLTDTGERANTDLVYAFNLLIFNTNVPNAVACNLGGYSYQYQIDYRTGGPASGATLGQVKYSLGNQLSSSPTVYSTSSSGASGNANTNSGGTVSNGSNIGTDANGNSCTAPSIGCTVAGSAGNIASNLNGNIVNTDALSNNSPADTRRSSWRELISE